MVMPLCYKRKCFKSPMKIPTKYIAAIISLVLLLATGVAICLFITLTNDKKQNKNKSTGNISTASLKSNQSATTASASPKSNKQKNKDGSHKPSENTCESSPTSKPRTYGPFKKLIEYPDVYDSIRNLPHAHLFLDDWERGVRVTKDCEKHNIAEELDFKKLLEFNIKLCNFHLYNGKDPIFNKDLDFYRQTPVDYERYTSFPIELLHLLPSNFVLSEDPNISTLYITGSIIKEGNRAQIKSTLLLAEAKFICFLKSLMSRKSSKLSEESSNDLTLKIKMFYQTLVLFGLYTESENFAKFVRDEYYGRKPPRDLKTYFAIIPTWKRY